MGAGGMDSAESVAARSVTDRRTLIRNIRRGNPQASFVAEHQDDELKTLFREHRLDWADPLSARTFGAWRDGLRIRRDEVRRSDGTYTLRTTTNEGKLRHAVLVVRALDFKPVRQTLRFVDMREIDIEEIATEAEDLGRSAEGPVPSSRPSPVAPAVRPPAVNLDALEVEVRLALHQKGADLGEDITVRPTGDSRLMVAGVIDTAARHKELVTALSSLPRTTIALRSAEEATTTGVTLALPASQAGTTRPALLEEWLERSFATPAAREAFVASALRVRRGIVSRAFALAALAERYTEPAMGKLAPAARSGVLRMVHDHQRVLESGVGELIKHLRPLLRETSPDFGAAPSIGAAVRETWQVRAAQQLQLMKVIDEAILELLTSGVDPVQRRAKMGHDDLSRADQVLQHLVRALDRLRLIAHDDSTSPFVTPAR